MKDVKNNEEPNKENVEEQQSESVENSEEKKKAKSKKIKIEESELEALRARVKELEDLKEGMVRKMADFENAKRRVEKEKEDFQKFASEKIISSFLSVLDNLDRALEHKDSNQSVESMLSGVELIRKQIFGILKDSGLEEVDAVGKEFDPHFHEALCMVPTAEQEPGTVVEQVQMGYMLKDRLLRPAWVKVAEESDESDDAQADETQDEQGNSSEEDKSK